MVAWVLLVVGITTPDSNNEPVVGGTVTRRIDEVWQEQEVEIWSWRWNFFVPRLDAADGVIIDADSGNDVFDQNESQLGDNNVNDPSNVWEPIDTGDNDGEVYVASNR